MEIPIFRCQDENCGHLFDSRDGQKGVLQEVRDGKPVVKAEDLGPAKGTQGKRFPKCPKCGCPFARHVQTRYTCDLDGCEAIVDGGDLPEAWIRTSFSAYKWVPVYQWVGARRVRGDATGNQRAGDFLIFPSCPVNLIFCTLTHAIIEQERQLGYLAEIEKQVFP